MFSQAFVCSQGVSCGWGDGGGGVTGGWGGGVSPGGMFCIPPVIRQDMVNRQSVCICAVPFS